MEHLFLETFLNSVLVTGLVVVMMMMIECLNVRSRGGLFGRLSGNRFSQVILSAFLGAIPGCMGGFASVSLYTHGMISFGALVAMMIASSGDESFVMLAMFPEQSAWIFLVLFAIAVAVGIIVDLLYPKGTARRCEASFAIHEADECAHCVDSDDSHRHGRHFTWQRAFMFAGVAVFISALAAGWLEHEHADACCEEAAAGGINLLNEEWMNVMFAVLSIFILVVLVATSDHFVEEHLWNHIVRKHLPVIFGWTFGVLMLVNVGMHYFDVSGWISDNTALMILLATLIGIIPESGPHMIFVTLYAAGVVPLPVLMASCISQDGHASLPLIAEDRRGFLRAKAVNCAVALAVGYGMMLFCI